MATHYDELTFCVKLTTYLQDEPNLATQGGFLIINISKLSTEDTKIYQLCMK